MYHQLWSTVICLWSAQNHSKWVKTQQISFFLFGSQGSLCTQQSMHVISATKSSLIPSSLKSFSSGHVHSSLLPTACRSRPFPNQTPAPKTSPPFCAGRLFCLETRLSSKPGGFLPNIMVALCIQCTSLAHLFKYYIGIVKSSLNEAILRFWPGQQPVFQHHSTPSHTRFYPSARGPTGSPFSLFSSCPPQLPKGGTAPWSGCPLTIPVWCSQKWKQSSEVQKKQSQQKPHTQKPIHHLPPSLRWCLGERQRTSHQPVKPELKWPSEALTSFLGTGAKTKNL